MKPLPTIYIVDDNEEHLRLSASFLHSQKWQIRTFPSGTALLEAELPAPGCILLDNMMPELTGVEMLTFLRERCLHLPIVFMSGESNYDQVFTATRQGAFAFLQKPVSGERLRQTVEKALAHSEHLMSEHEARGDVQELYNKLTDREKEIFQLLASGKHNKMISNTLGISLRTVEFHRANIQRKLKANFLSDLIAIAKNLGI